MFNGKSLHQRLNPFRWGTALSIKQWLVPTTLAWFYYLFLRFNYIASKTEGYFTFLLDDSYIHLGIAKNLYERGVFGLTENFSAVSSSPLYTFVIYLLNLGFGLNEYYPLFINIAGSVGVLWYCLLFLREIKVHFITALVVVIPLFVFSSIELLVFTGMEHVWHILFLLNLITYVIQPKPNFWKIALVSLLLSATRYEGLFSVAVAILWLFWQAKMPIRQLIVIAIAAWLPAGIYGIVSVYHGGFFLPNSLMLKSTDIIYTPGIMFPLLKIGQLFNQIPLNALSLLAGVILIVNRLDLSKLGHLFIVFGTLLIHIFFGKYGWVWRYETYLIFILGFFCFTQLAQLQLNGKWYVGLIKYLPICLIISFRGASVYKGEVIASRNIYAQMVQMARFAKTYFGTETIAVNDVGAVSFFANTTPMDCAGLSDNQIMHLVLKGAMFTPENFRKLANNRKANYAMLFPHVYWPMHDKNWVECGKFTTKYNLVCADSTVLFFALDSSRAPYLKSSLAQFKMQAPADCKVEVYGVDYQ